MRPRSLSSDSEAKPSSVADPRSPPEPLTQSTSTVSPVRGSTAGSLADVFPPPKLVIRRSDPRRLERYCSSSSSERVAAWFASHWFAIRPPPVGAADVMKSLCAHAPLGSTPARVNRKAAMKPARSFPCANNRRALVRGSAGPNADFCIIFCGSRLRACRLVGARMLCYMKHSHVAGR